MIGGCSSGSFQSASELCTAYHRVVGASVAFLNDDFDFEEARTEYLYWYPKLVQAANTVGGDYGLWAKLRPESVTKDEISDVNSLVMHMRLDPNDPMFFFDPMRDHCGS